MYHSVDITLPKVYLLLCWHISTGASQNTKLEEFILHSTPSFRQVEGGMVGYAKYDKRRTAKPNSGYLIAGE